MCLAFIFSHIIFIVLRNVKMPTAFYVETSIMINSMLNCVEHKKN